MALTYTNANPAGTLTLNGNNTFTGGTTLSGGALQIGAATIFNGNTIQSSAIGTGTLIFNGGTLQAGGSYTIGNAGQINSTGGTIDANGYAFTYSGAIGNGSGTPAGSLTIVDSSGQGGTVTFSSANTYSGATNIGDGTNPVTLALSGAGSISNSSSVSIVSGATFDISGVTTALSASGIPPGLTGTTINALQDGSNGNINLGGNALFINNQTAKATFGGVISGVAQTPNNGSCSQNCLPAQGVSLGLNGGGTLTLTGANTYTGYTGIFGGTLALAQGGDISASGGVAIANGATFDISGLSGAGTTVAGLQSIGNGSGGTVNLGSKTLTVGSSSGVALNQNESSQFSGVIQGSGGLSTAGTGTLTLTGVNTYTGATTINSGTLALAAQFSNNCNGNCTPIENGDISASSGVTINGTGTFDISGLQNPNNSSPASTTIAAITDDASGNGNIYLGGNTLTVGTTSGANPNASSSFSGVISDCGTSGQCIAAQNCTNCTPSGGSLVKAGIGTLKLSGNNTYGGGTTINAGILAVTLGSDGLNNSSVGSGTVTLNGGTFQNASGDGTTPHALSFTNAFNLAGNGTLDTNGAKGGNLTITGQVSGAGALSIIGGNTVTLDDSGSTVGGNNYSGGTTVGGGSTVAVTTSTSVGTGTVTLNTGTFQNASPTNATLSFGNTFYLGQTNGGGVAGGTFDTTNGNITITGLVADATNAGSLAVTGGGTLRLDDASVLGGNTYSGGTSVTNGSTVAVTTSTSVGTDTVTLAGGIFQNASGTSLTFSNAFNLGAGGGALDTTGGDLKLNGLIADASPKAGNLMIVGGGTVTLTNQNNSYDGGTVVAGSTLAVTNSGAAGTGFVGLVDGTFKNAAANGSSALSFGQTFYLGTVGGAGATIDLNGSSGGNVTISGLVADVPSGVNFNGTPVTAGALTVTGGNTLTLTNANTYSGGTEINGGSTVAVTQGSASPTTPSASSVGSGTVTLNNGTFQNAAGNGTTATALTFANAFNLAGNGTIDTNGLNGGNITLNGTVSGTGGLTVTGGGTVTLTNSGGDTYSGTTTINPGATLAGGAAGAFSAKSAVTNNGTLDLGSQNQAIGGLSGSGTVTNLTNPQNAQVGSIAVLTVNNGGTFGGTIIDGNVTGVTTGLNVASGNLTLTGSNTYSGGTTIASGATLSLIHSNGVDIDSAGSGQITIASGTLELAPTSSAFPNSVAGALRNAINIDTSATIEATSGKIARLQGSFTSSGTIEQLTFGSQTDTGTVAFEPSSVSVAGLGTLEVAGGTLQDGQNGTLGQLTSLASTTQIDNSATLDFNGNSGIIANLQGSGTLTNSAGSIAPATVTIVNGNFAGAIVGSGINITIGSAVILSGNNTYSGTTTISKAATLTGGAADSFSHKSAITDNGTLDLGGFNQTIGSLAGQGIVTNSGSNANATLTIGTDNTTTAFSGTIQDGTSTTAINKTGLGTLTLSGTNAYSGGTTISGGTLAVSQDANLGNASGTLSFNGGTLQYLASFDTARAITLNASGGTIDTNSFNSTLSGTIGGAGSLTKIGVGTLTLSGTNSYQGGTNINAGTVAVSNDANLGQSGGALNFNGGTLQYLASFDSARGGSLSSLGGTIDTGIFNTELSGNFSGGGGLTKTGAGTLTLSGKNTYGGATTINGGTLAGGAVNSFSTSSAVTINNGTLDLGGYNQTIASLGGASTAVVTNSGNSAATLTTGGNVFAGVIKDGGAVNTTALVEVGNATLVLSGANTYTGGTTIDSGTLMLGAGGTSGSITGNVVDNGAFAINRSDTYTFVGVISGSGAFQQFGTGTTILTGTNSYAGGTDIISGTLAVSKDANLGQNGGALTFNGGTLKYLGGFTDTARAVTLYNFGGTIDTNSFNSTLSGNISGAGALTKIGAGTLTLTGAETYSGATNVDAGTLMLDSGGSINSSGDLNVAVGATFAGIGNVTVPTFNVTGTLAPGSTSKPTGTLNIAGNLVFATASTYLVTINGSNYSSTTVTGTANLSGATLKIVASQITPGMTYTLLTANGKGGLTGTTFASTASSITTSSGSGYSESVSYTKNNVDAVFSPLTPSGALNSEGQLSIQNMQTSFATTLLNPNVSGRSGAPGGGIGGYGPALGFAPETQPTPEEQAAYDAVTPHEPLDALMRSLNTGYSHSVWASAYGGYSHISGDSATGNSTATTGGGGIASGIDFRLGADTVLGVALGGGGASWSLSGGQGNGNSETFQAGVYGSHRFGDAYISGTLAYALNSMHTTRNITTPSTAQLTASFDANGVTGRIESGYRFGLPDVGITPYIAGEFSALRTPSYSEGGSSAFALSYNAETQTNERAEIGVWADKFIPVANDAIVRLGARAGYAHDWWSSTSFNGQFVSLPTQSFTMTGITPPSDLGLASLLAEIRYRNGVSLSAKFDAELGSNAYSFAGTGTFRYAW